MKMSGRTRALEFDPEAVTPISAAFMLAPTILRMLSFGPFPIVRMHLQLEFRAILVPRLHVPAIAVVVTHNFQPRRQLRRASTRQSQSQSLLPIFSSLFLRK